MNQEIKNIGSYVQLDSEGFIINPSSKEKIQPEWTPVVDAVVAAYKEHGGANLASVYIRGSVAKGTAISFVSDIDTFAYANTSSSEIDTSWLDAAEKSIIKEFPFVTGVELSVDPIVEYQNDAIMLAQAVCVYGKDVALALPKLRPGKDLVAHAYKLMQSFEWLRNRIQVIKGNTEEEKKASIWLGKLLLRSGFEITMNRSHCYTRDLYLCYEMFSKYYPEKEAEMRAALSMAINPTADVPMLEHTMDEFGVWLAEEAKKQLI